jgi:hypothetical protein
LEVNDQNSVFIETQVVVLYEPYLFHHDQGSDQQKYRHGKLQDNQHFGEKVFSPKLEFSPYDIGDLKIGHDQGRETSGQNTHRYHQQQEDSDALGVIKRMSGETFDRKGIKNREHEDCDKKAKDDRNQGRTYGFNPELPYKLFSPGPEHFPHTDLTGSYRCPSYRHVDEIDDSDTKYQ